MAKNKLSESFEDWIISNGGEYIHNSPAEKPWEEHRFKACGNIHVIYCGKRGRNFSDPEAEAIYDAFSNGQRRRLSERSGKYGKSARLVKKLLDRDGDLCFFCCIPFSEDDPPTLEHIIARRHGGPNHMSNYALAHFKCNREADDLPAIGKFAIRHANIAPPGEEKNRK